MAHASQNSEIKITAKPLSLVVSVLPQKFLVEKIGKQHVSVMVMAGPGQNPTTYEPAARQIAALHASDAYLCIGVPFESAWIRPVIKSKSSLPVIDVRNNKRLTALTFNVTKSHSHDNDESHHNDNDPHLWNSPAQLITVSRNVRDILSKLDPANADAFTHNLTALEYELNELDLFIREKLQEYNVTRFMVFHPAWGHFAKQYGLTQIAIEQHGKSPGAKAITRLIEQAKKHNIKTLFSQTQFSHRSAKMIANAIGGNVVIVDPLAEDVIHNLRHFVTVLTNKHKS